MRSPRSSRWMFALVAVVVAGCAVVPPPDRPGVPSADDQTATARPLPSVTAAPVSPTPAPTTASPTPSKVTPPAPTTTPSATQSPTATPETPSGKPPNCAKLKCVALTFDDGPVKGTATLLDTLKVKGVHATFFTLGYRVRERPALMRRMAAEGHVIGNHTWSHPQLTRLGTRAIRREISRTNAAIKKATGTRPKLLRPPYGDTNSTVRKVAASYGMALILWDVDPLDWRDTDSDVVTKRVLADARPGSIILSHDTHSTTRAAYSRIIDGLRKKGFTLVTVPELLGSRLKPGASFSQR